jgi:hypothetical protein
MNIKSWGRRIWFECVLGLKSEGMLPASLVLREKTKSCREDSIRCSQSLGSFFSASTARNVVATRYSVANVTAGLQWDRNSKTERTYFQSQQTVRMRFQKLL